MNPAKAANTEPIPGYRLIAPLGSGGFGEVWRCEAPGGLFKAVKFVRGEGDGVHPDDAGAAQELHALQHIKALRHPFLLSMDRVEFVDGDLVIVMELADRSLHDLLDDYRAAGRPGIPRAELIGYLGEAAEVLDLLNQEHGLQHLDIKPRNLFLVGRHIKVADFGLVNSLAEMNGGGVNTVLTGGVTPVYAAPECFLGKAALFSDQYSLAITYHELLVGEPPFVGKNFRQLALQHMQADPDVSRLPEADRPLIRQALAKDPRGRFPSCSAFIEALKTNDGGEFRLPRLTGRHRTQRDTQTDILIANLSSTPVGSNAMPRMSPSSEVVLDNRPAANAENAMLETPPAQPAPPTLGGSTDTLAGYQFLDCLTWTEGRETWTARTEDGDRLVQFFSGIHWEGDKEKERLNFLRTLRHDAVEPMELIAGPDHKLVLITEACPKTLATRLQECQTAGLPGIPRPELLARLNTAAEALDDLFEEHGVRHLGLTPRHLVLKNGRLRLLHLGVAELIRLSAGGLAAAANPRYSAAAPSEEPHPSSDAYSLALIYCELLTGFHPLRNLGSRKSASARRPTQPDLSLLSLADRAVLLRALHADANRRFASCTDFMAALDADSANSSTSASCGPTTSLSCDLADAAFPTTMLVRMRQLINGLVAGAAADLEVREYRNARYLLRPGCRLEHQFFARITQGVSQLMADGFRLQWKAKLVESNERRIVLLVSLTASLWLRLMGIKPGLKVAIDIPQGATGAISEVRVRIEPVGCGREAALALMEEAAPKLLDSLRTFYQAQPERRSQARLPFDQVLEVLPVLQGCKEGEVVYSRARDISMQGMRFYMPCRPPSQQVNIRLPGWSSGRLASLPASVVRIIPCDDGGYEVGVRFVVEEVAQSR